MPGNITTPQVLFSYSNALKNKKTDIATNNSEMLVCSGEQTSAPEGVKPVKDLSNGSKVNANENNVATKKKRKNRNKKKNVAPADDNVNNKAGDNVNNMSSVVNNSVDISTKKNGGIAECKNDSALVLPIEKSKKLPLTSSVHNISGVANVFTENGAASVNTLEVTHSETVNINGVHKEEDSAKGNGDDATNNGVSATDNGDVKNGDSATLNGDVKNGDSATLNGDVKNGDSATLNGDSATLYGDSATNNVYSATNNVDSATLNGDSATNNVDSATLNGDSATNNVDSATLNGDSTTNNGDSATNNVDSATLNGESATLNGDSATKNGDSATKNGESATLNGVSSTNSGVSATNSGVSATNSGVSATNSGVSATNSGESATNNVESATNNGESATEKVNAKKDGITTMNCKSAKKGYSTGLGKNSTIPTNGASMNITESLPKSDKVPTENGTVTAENCTVTAENGTVTAENGTVTAENGTVTAENGTVTAENGTVTAENGTVPAENDNVAAENGVSLGENFGALTMNGVGVDYPDIPFHAPHYTNYSLNTQYNGCDAPSLVDETYTGQYSVLVRMMMNEEPVPSAALFSTTNSRDVFNAEAEAFVPSNLTHTIPKEYSEMLLPPNNQGMYPGNLNPLAAEFNPEDTVVEHTAQQYYGGNELHYSDAVTAIERLNGEVPPEVHPELYHTGAIPKRKSRYSQQQELKSNSNGPTSSTTEGLLFPQAESSHIPTLRSSPLTPLLCSDSSLHTAPQTTPATSANSEELQANPPAMEDHSTADQSNNNPMTIVNAGAMNVDPPTNYNMAPNQLVEGVANMQVTDNCDPESIDMNGTNAVPPPNNNLTEEQVTEALKALLEKYITRSTFTSDKFISSQLDNNLFLPIKMLLEVDQFKAITTDVEVLKSVIRSEEAVCDLDESGEKVRFKNSRNIIMLREIVNEDDDVIKELHEIFSEVDAPKDIEYIPNTNGCWYVKFKSESEAEAAFNFLHLNAKEFRGKIIKARMKCSTAKTTQWTGPPNGNAPRNGPMQGHPNMGHMNGHPMPQVGSPAMGVSLPPNMYTAAPGMKAPISVHGGAAHPANTAAGAPLFYSPHNGAQSIALQQHHQQMVLPYFHHQLTSPHLNSYFFPSNQLIPPPWGGSPNAGMYSIHELIANNGLSPTSTYKPTTSSVSTNHRYSTANTTSPAVSTASNRSRHRSREAAVRATVSSSQPQPSPATYQSRMYTRPQPSSSPSMPYFNAPPPYQMAYHENMYQSRDEDLSLPVSSTDSSTHTSSASTTHTSMVNNTSSSSMTTVSSSEVRPNAPLISQPPVLNQDHYMHNNMIPQRSRGSYHYGGRGGHAPHHLPQHRPNYHYGGVGGYNYNQVPFGGMGPRPMGRGSRGGRGRMPNQRMGGRDEDHANGMGGAMGYHQGMRMRYNAHHENSSVNNRSTPSSNNATPRQARVEAVPQAKTSHFALENNSFPPLPGADDTPTTPVISSASTTTAAAVVAPPEEIIVTTADSAPALVTPVTAEASVAAWNCSDSSTHQRFSDIMKKPKAEPSKCEEDASTPPAPSPVPSAAPPEKTADKPVKEEVKEQRAPRAPKGRKSEVAPSTQQSKAKDTKPTATKKQSVVNKSNNSPLVIETKRASVGSSSPPPQQAAAPPSPPQHNSVTNDKEDDEDGWITPKENRRERAASNRNHSGFKNHQYGSKHHNNHYHNSNQTQMNGNASPPPPHRRDSRAKVHHKQSNESSEQTAKEVTSVSTNKEAPVVANANNDKSNNSTANENNSDGERVQTWARVASLNASKAVQNNTPEQTAVEKKTVKEVKEEKEQPKRVVQSSNNRTGRGGRHTNDRGGSGRSSGSSVGRGGRSDRGRGGYDSFRGAPRSSFREGEERSYKESSSPNLQPKVK